MCVFVFNGILIVRKSQIVLFESLQVHQKQTCKRKSVFLCRHMDGHFFVLYSPTLRL